MRVRPPKSDHEQPQQVRWEGQVPPPRRSTPLLFRLFRGFAGSLSGGILLLGVIAGIGLWRSGEQFVNGIKMALTPPEPEEQVDVRTVVVQQVKGASELTTAVFTMEAVVPATSTRTIANYEVGKTTLIYIAHGEVEAGVDLSEIQVFDYNRGFLGLGPDRAPDLQDKAEEAALDRILVAACDQGILQEASDRAELVVGQLLQNTGYDQVVVESRPSANANCAAAGTTTVQ